MATETYKHPECMCPHCGFIYKVDAVTERKRCVQAIEEVIEETDDPSELNVLREAIRKNPSLLLTLSDLYARHETNSVVVHAAAEDNLLDCCAHYPRGDFQAGPCRYGRSRMGKADDVSVCQRLHPTAMRSLGIPFTYVPRKKYATKDFWGGEDGKNDPPFQPIQTNQEAHRSWTSSVPVSGSVKL